MSRKLAVIQRSAGVLRRDTGLLIAESGALDRLDHRLDHRGVGLDRLVQSRHRAAGLESLPVTLRRFGKSGFLLVGHVRQTAHLIGQLRRRLDFAVAQLLNTRRIGHAQHSGLSAPGLHRFRIGHSSAECVTVGSGLLISHQRLQPGRQLFASRFRHLGIIRQRLLCLLDHRIHLRLIHVVQRSASQISLFNSRLTGGFPFHALLNRTRRNVRSLGSQSHHADQRQRLRRYVFRGLPKPLRAFINRLGVFRRLAGQYRIRTRLIISLVELRDAFSGDFRSDTGKTGGQPYPGALRGTGRQTLDRLFTQQAQRRTAAQRQQRVTDRFRPGFPQTGVLRNRQHLLMQVGFFGFGHAASGLGLHRRFGFREYLIQKTGLGHAVARRARRAHRRSTARQRPGCCGTGGKTAETGQRRSAGKTGTAGRFQQRFAGGVGLIRGLALIDQRLIVGGLPVHSVNQAARPRMISVRAVAADIELRQRAAQ